MRKEQKRCKRNFNARIRHVRQDLHPDEYAFDRKEHLLGGHKHKFYPVADDPYRVISVDKGTVVLHIGDQDERISRDRLVEAPQPHPGMRFAVVDPPLSGKLSVKKTPTEYVDNREAPQAPGKTPATPTSTFAPPTIPQADVNTKNTRPHDTTDRTPDHTVGTES